MAINLSAVNKDFLLSTADDERQNFRHAAAMCSSFREKFWLRLRLRQNSFHAGYLIEV